MALRYIPRRRVPKDGTWILTEAKLNSVLRSASLYDDDFSWPKFVDETWVPLWVKLMPHWGEATRTNPEGTYYHPVVRVGSFASSPEVELTSPYAANLFKDGDLDGWDNENKWLYRPHPEFAARGAGHGEDASCYECDQCGRTLYRDETGRRHDRSACIFGGSLVCRDCDVTGLVYTQDVEDRIALCRKLADHVGPECRRKLDRQLETLGSGFSSGNPAQTRLSNDCKWSFYFTTTIFTPDGKKRGMNGGLIQHGPHPTLNDDGSWTFTTWDYKESRERPATAEEISYIDWSIHT